MGGESEDTNITITQRTHAMALPKNKVITDDVISQINDYGLDVINREIFLFPREDYIHGGVDEDFEPGVEYGMAGRFIRHMRLLANISHDPILIHLKTEGGDWVQGLAMYQAIKASPCRIVMLNYASARSMSSVIFSAADYRVMMPFSTFMIHTGTNCIVGTGTQVMTEYEEIQKADKIMYDIYIGHLRGSEMMKGWSDKKIDTWIRKQMKEKEDVYFNAEEAVDHNFADTIFGADGVYDWDALIK